LDPVFIVLSQGLKADIVPDKPIKLTALCQGFFSDSMNFLLPVQARSKFMEFCMGNRHGGP
jgi:hypothetical protein